MAMVASEHEQEADDTQRPSHVARKREAHASVPVCESHTIGLSFAGRYAF